MRRAAATPPPRVPGTDHGPRSIPLTLLVVAVFAVAARLQAVLVLVPAYRDLYDRHRFFVPETLKSLLEIALVALAVVLVHRLRLGAAARELGFRRPVAWPLVMALLATLPMAVVFFFTAGVRPELPAAEIAYLALLSPLAEEVVFRGFAFRQLHRRAGWGFWPSVLVTALVFGLVHVEGGRSMAQIAGIFLVTAVGGALFAWLFTVWGDSLAAPFALHAAMNLCWQLFAVGESALAGWLPTALQATTALSAIGITLLLRRRLAVAGTGEELGR